MVKAAIKTTVQVLLVDENRDEFLLIRDLLAAADVSCYRLDWQSDYDKALELICSGQFAVVLVAPRFGARTGLDLLNEVRRRGYKVPIVIFTGQGDHEADLEAMQSGAMDFVEKSRLDAVLLERTIRYAIRHKDVEAELERGIRERSADLDRANESLREAERSTDEFLCTLAHELRNPLAPIRNALEIIRLSGDSATSVATGRVLLERQVAKLARLLDDLLDVALLSRRQIRLRLERTAIDEVLAEALDECRPLLSKAGLSATHERSKKPIWVHADRIRMVQVVYNLLNNAAKYCDTGGSVWLGAVRDGSTASISVRDTGVGMSPEIVPKLFQPFARCDRGADRSRAGLGVGLALVKQLIEMHGGTVTARSDGLGRGSEFTVTLPCLNE